MSNLPKTEILSDEPNFICLSSINMPQADKWEKSIREGASYSQDRTSIRLERAYCRVYQPTHWGSKEFDPLKRHLAMMVAKVITSIDRVDDRVFYIEDGAWGLIYADGESCGPHGHGKVPEYAGVYYLKTTPGCGSIYFPEAGIEVEPKSGDMVLFGSRVQHVVLPNVVPNSERVCVAFNVRKEQ